MKPYYEDTRAGITIYHGDCREVLPLLGTDAAFMVTDPPYPNNAGHFTGQVSDALWVLSRWSGITALVFWNELDRPPVNLPLVALHIWHRTNVNGRPYEAIYHFQADGDKRRSEIKQCGDVVIGQAIMSGPAFQFQNQFCGHPTQKNIDVMLWLIQKIRPRVIICDPFCGSGTTLMAAKDLGRRAIGIEIEERYCEIAAKRLSQEVLEFKP